MRLFLLCVVALAAAVPVALADGQPSPAAVAACQAEAAHLGKDAFVAKYGPTEPFGHCYAAHADASPPPTTTAPALQDSPAVAACKAEYEHLGADAFLAKYGTTETLGHCVAAHTAEPTHDPPAVAVCKSEAEHVGPCVAAAHKPDPKQACMALGKKLGKHAFTAKYGDKNPLAACITALRPANH